MYFEFEEEYFLINKHLQYNKKIADYQHFITFRTIKRGK